MAIDRRQFILALAVALLHGTEAVAAQAQKGSIAGQPGGERGQR